MTWLIYIGDALLLAWSIYLPLALAGGFKPRALDMRGDQL